MKKIVITFLLVASSIGTVLKADNLLTAIDNCDVYMVDTLLDQHEHLDKEYKKTLEKAASVSAKIAKRKAAWLFASGYDMIRFTAGFGMFGSSIGVAVATAIFVPDDLKAPMFIGDACFCLIGLNQIYKGWMLTSARNRLKKAREIQALIVKKSIYNQ
jgi:hypothetical protein